MLSARLLRSHLFMSHAFLLRSAMVRVLGNSRNLWVLYIVVHPSITTTISRQDCIYEKRESQQVDGSKIGPTTVASRYWIRSWIEVLEGGEVTEGH